MATGRLSLATTPWTQVYFHGRSLGETPLSNASLPVGHQKLTLVNPDRGIKTTIDVEIKANQQTVKRLKL